MMAVTRARLGARSRLEVRANSRQSLMITTAAGCGRERLGWRTPGVKRSQAEIIFGDCSSLVTSSSAVTPSISASSLMLANS